MPSINQPLQPIEIDEETSDRDKEKKQKEKEYADDRRNAKPNAIQEGDPVLVKRMNKPNKLSSSFDPEIHKVQERKGSSVIIKSNETGKSYRRNVAHLKKLEASNNNTTSKITDTEPIAKRTRQFYSSQLN